MCPAAGDFGGLPSAYRFRFAADSWCGEQAPKKMQRSDGSQAQMGGHEHIAALLEGVMLARGVASGKEL